MSEHEKEKPHLGIFYAENSMIIVCKSEVRIRTKIFSGECVLYSTCGCEQADIRYEACGIEEKPYI